MSSCKEGKRGLKKFAADRLGGPLAEFALVIPFLLILLFGGFEFSRVLYAQNMITKSVQDAARYAARHPAVIENGSCVPSSAAWTTVQANAETMVRRGNLDAGAPLLHPDFGTAVVDVDVECVAPPGTAVTSNPSGGNTDIPVVVVNATVTLSDIGFFHFIGDDAVVLTAEHREMAIGL